MLGKKWWMGWCFGLILAYAFMYFFEITNLVAAFFIGFLFTIIPATLAKKYL